MDYKEAVDYIFGHTNYEMVPRVPHETGGYDLRRLFELLERTGNPHLKARSLHIAGTNGKGSTSAMLASVLTSAGYTTGLYTSPHLVTMRERIIVNGEMIGESEVAEIMNRLRPEIETVDRKATYGKLTVFEILTALGLNFFAEKNCRFQVMEVGMGGRFDATNVIQPEVCLLTSISYDHMEVLGNTLTRIAGEKCGIIKPGCVVISHPQVEEADRVIEKTCLDKGVRLVRLGRDILYQGLKHDFEHQDLEVQGRLGKYRLSIPLLGQYQLPNAAAAVAALEVLIERGFRLSINDIVRGLAGVKFPGRMEILVRKPFIVVDGGHNPEAAHNLRETLLKYFEPDRSILVVGISSDKDVPGIVRELVAAFDMVIVTRANNPRSTEPAVLAAEFAKYGSEVQVVENIPAAIESARKAATDLSLICITGSLFVVGEAEAYFRS
jgi:dihydrofolate synthase/folylpolyglutamate synthase